MIIIIFQNAKGYMAYTDVSMGTKVSGYNTGMGRLNVMCQNPANAIIHLGHFSGISEASFIYECHRYTPG